MKILSVEEVMNIYSNVLNEIIKDSIDPHTLNKLNENFAELELDEKEIKQVVNGLYLEPNIKKSVLKEQLRLSKFHKAKKRNPYLYNSLEWNKNGKRRNSPIEESHTDKRKLNGIISNIKDQNQNSDRLSKNDFGQQMEF